MCKADRGLFQKACSWNCSQSLVLLITDPIFMHFFFLKRKLAKTLYICTGYIFFLMFCFVLSKRIWSDLYVSRLGHTHIRFKPKYRYGYLLHRVLFALNPLSPQVQRAVQRLFCSYLGMLVNTKNDLALAHTLNTPNRCLGRTAFTDLKHAARKSNTSLFLVNVSLRD